MTATLVPRPTAPGAPAAREGHAVTDPGDRGRSWLARVLAGELALPGFSPIHLPPAERDPAEHAAAARAAACPDLFVVHADPVAGERLLFDLATTTPDRVLIVSPNCGALDRLAERLLGAAVPVLRALNNTESPERLPEAVGKVTSAALGFGRAAQSRREADEAVAAAEARLAAFAPVSKAIARLTEVNDALARRDAERALLTTRRDLVEVDLRAETDTPFARALAQLDADRATAVARRTAELQTATAARDEKQAALEHARHLHAEALRKPGLLTRLFSAKPKPGAVEPADLEKQVPALEAEAGALAERVRELEAAATAADASYTAARAGLVANELATRREALAGAVATAEADLARLRVEGTALQKVIATAVPGDKYESAQAALTAAREKVAEAARAVSPVPARVVVGTPGSLGADPVFASQGASSFGLLVLDRAEELTEHDFSWLARLAERCVLVGHAVPEEPRGARGRGEPPFASRLAWALDRETWAAEGNRLVCRLAPPDPEQRRRMTREPLADRPEIELRFVETGADPQLAEITFPWNTPVADAKRFLVDALSEVRLRPCGELRWDHAPDAIVATWPAADTADGVWVDLEPGVREKVAGSGPFAFTAAVRFDPAEGWDAERAAAWLDARIPGPSASRFAALPRTSGSRG